MIDIIGDPLLQILEYLDFKSIVTATEVSQTWRNAILQHRQIFIRFCNRLAIEAKNQPWHPNQEAWSIFNEFENTTTSSKELLSLCCYKQLGEPCYDKATPLHLAYYYGYDQIAQHLIEKGARLDIRNYKDETPLQGVLESLEYTLLLSMWKKV